MTLIFSKEFWKQYFKNPRIALERIDTGKSIFNIPLKFILFWRIVFSEYWQNHCIARASGLAFALLMTLIPLLAALSFMLANFVEVHYQQMETIVKTFLPYAPPTIVDRIMDFFENTKKIRGVGIAVLIVIAAGLLGTIEESLNTIWKASRTRSFFNQLRMFTMVMVYGPLFFFASFQFRKVTLLNFLSHNFFFTEVLPFLFLVLAFTVFMWLIPNTRVYFKSAVLGGLATGILFEAERRGFGEYIRYSMETQTIYGAYGILIFFLVSLFFMGLFILFGAEITYVCQNFRALVKSKSMHERRISDHKSYLAVRMMVDLLEAFRQNQPPYDLQRFSTKYEVTEPQAQSILGLLEKCGFVHAIRNSEAFVPAFDVSQVRLRDLIHAVEEQGRKIPIVPNDAARDFLSHYMESLKEGTHAPQYDLTFSGLMRALESPAVPLSKKAKAV